MLCITFCFPYHIPAHYEGSSLKLIIKYIKL